MPRLTKSFVERTEQPGYYRDSELPGFCVRISVGPKSGVTSKVYLINTKPRGSRKNLSVTIGKHEVIGSERARLEAKRILGLLAQGINPNEQRKKILAEAQKLEQAKQVKKRIQQITLQHLLNDYIAARKLKEKTVKDYLRFTKRCLRDWLNMPIVNITRDMVQARHSALSIDHPAQANYTMRILRALFCYALSVYEDDDGKPILTTNPVDRLKQARVWNHIPRRQTVIRAHQMRDWYQGICALTNAGARDLLLVEMFTGLRHSEAASLSWNNIDFHARTIKIEDTKNRDDHMLPMSTFLYDLLIKRYNAKTSSEYVFPGTGKHGHITDIRNSIRQVSKLSRVSFTEHDLRRTFETTAESLDIAYYSLKRLLNHRVTGDPTAGYIVSSAERLREAAQKIADFLSRSMGLS